MSLPIAVQLYSLREELEHDFENVIRQMAAIGFAGVETASFPSSVSTKEASELFKELGLVVAGAHLPLPIGDAKNQVIETAKTLECDWIVNGAIDRELFKTTDGILRACELFNESGRSAAENGLRFAVHNHWWEFEEVDGVYPYQVMLDKLDPSICFELDAYWIQVAGHEPQQIVREFGDRAPFIHVKDGPASDIESPMVAAGDGVVDYPRIIEASGENAEWLIVELDRCATDMMEAISSSYIHLTRKGLAHGKQS